MDYTGYKKVILTDDELARIYQEGKCDSCQSGNVKPKTFEQHFAMDLLQDRQITVKLIRGVYGSGRLFATFVK